MAKAEMIEIAILPTAMASAMTRLFSIIRADRRDSPDTAPTPRRQRGLAVVLPELVARQQRHGHAGTSAQASGWVEATKVTQIGKATTRHRRPSR